MSIRYKVPETYTFVAGLSAGCLLSASKQSPERCRPKRAWLSQLPSKISIAFALPFQLKLALPLALVRQLSLLLLARIGLAPCQNLLKPVADGVGPCLVDGFICPKIMPRNPCQALLGLCQGKTA